MNAKGFVCASPAIILEYDPVTGRFTFYRSGSEYPRLAGSVIQVSFAQSGSKHIVEFPAGAKLSDERSLQDEHGTGWQWTLSGPPASGLGIDLVINCYEQRPFMLLRMIVRNQTGQVISLQDLTLLQATPRQGSQVRFGSQPHALDFFKVGWHDWVYTGLRHAGQRDVTTRLGYFIGKMLFNPAAPSGRGQGDFWGDGWGILTDQKTAILTGFVSTADQFGLVHANCRPGQNALALIAQADGIQLDPGEIFQSEWGYIQFLDLPSPDPAAEYVEAVARQMRARVPIITPPAHWTHWYQFFQNITEELFIANLEVIERQREMLPFQIVQLDDGYQSAWGDWDTCNHKFPNGLGHLAGRIREKGYTPGLWLAPFVVDPRSRIAREHPNWLVQDRQGKPIRSGYFYQFFGHALDLTLPAVQDHVRALLDKIAHEWGFGFIKTDFVYAGALPGVRANRKMTRAQAFRRGMEAVRQGIGEETFWLGCGCPFGPAIGLVDAMRIGPDTAPNWTPYLWSMKWATPLIKNELSLAALRNNVRHTLNLSTLHRRWWWNDPDCLMVRNYDTSLTEDEVVSNISLVGLSGGLMINSDDLTRLSSERQKLMNLLLPVLSKGGHPLDGLEQEMAELYALPVETGWQAWQDVAVFNWSDRPANRRLDLNRLGWQGGSSWHVFDFWNRAYCRLTNPIMDLGTLPVHGCRLLRICRADNAPTLVGDTLHITQGAEIAALEVTGNILRLETLDLSRRAEGELWFWLPRPPKDAAQDGRTIPILPGQQAGEDIYRVRLNFWKTTSLQLAW